MNQFSRIVITGYATINPIGKNPQEFFHALSQGKNGVGALSRIESSHLATKYGAEIKDFDPQEHFAKREIRKMDRFSQFSSVAGKSAFLDAGLDVHTINPERTGCIFGVGLGGMNSYEYSLFKYRDDGPRSIPIMTISHIIPNSGSSNVAMNIGNILGPNYTINTACSSGNDAIGAAMRHLLLGEADIMIAGGVESNITGFSIGSFNVLHALSTKWEHEPSRASRPFDKDRDGFVMGEGVGVLVLETLEHAQKRGARIRAELVSAVNTCDAFHHTAPDPNGKGIVRAMELAITRGNISPNDIDYINAHGTSTPTNDVVETKAIKQVFGDHAYNKLRISSTKSMTGHCIGAASAIEAVACVLALEQQFIPPTINLDNPDPDCDLNYTPHTAIDAPVNYAMSNSLGFGGHNSSVIFKKFA